MEWTYRNVKEGDFDSISQFPQTPAELYYMYPSAHYPLTADQLERKVGERLQPTVFEASSLPVGYANLYQVEAGVCGYVGNLITHPAYRGKGLGKYIMDVMIGKLKDEYHVAEARLTCFCENTGALLMYEGMGFVPYKVERRIGYRGMPVVALSMKKNI